MEYRNFIYKDKNQINKIQFHQHMRKSNSSHPKISSESVKIGLKSPPRKSDRSAFKERITESLKKSVADKQIF